MRFPIPGGIYGFALPDRTHGAMMEAGFIDTSNGRVELPGEGIARLDGARWRGQLFMAGEGGESGHAWLWTAGKWRELGPTHGVNCCAFGDGVLHIAISGDTYRTVNLDTFEMTTHDPFPIGGQGIRYVNEQNAPVFGDATIGFDPAEFTVRGDVTVGQGHDGGTMVNGRIIEPGQCFFPRFKRSGDLLATYTVKFAEHQGVAHWITRAEVDTLPLPGAPPVVIVPPVTPPTPPVEPIPVTFPVPARVKEIVQALYERNVVLAEGDDDQRRALILKIAQQVAFELGSQWGTKRAAASNPPSKDALAHFDGVTLYGADCFDGTTRKPSVPDVMGALPGQQFIAVTATNHLAGVVIPPTPPLPADASFGASAAALERRFAALVVVVETLKAEVAELRNVPPAPPTLEGGIDGKRIALRTENGHYVGVYGGGGAGVYADRTEVKGWEVFTIEEK